jgi:hypothetical protein
MRNTDTLVQDFLETTDAATQLEKELNEFAAEITPVLLKMKTAVKAYRDAVYSINLIDQHPYYVIRLGNVTEYRNTLNTPYEGQTRVLRADFEFDPDHTLEEQVRSVVTALLFRVYNLFAKPEESDDGVVRCKV